MSNDLANLEALMNIGANLGEILGIAGGAPILLWSWMPRAGGIRGCSLKVAGLGLLTVILALAAPGVTNVAAGINPLLGLLASWGLCLPIIGLVIYNLRTPTAIARRIGHPDQRGICILNYAAFVPAISGIAYLGAMIWVSFIKKDQRKAFQAQTLGCGDGHTPET